MQAFGLLQDKCPSFGGINHHERQLIRGAVEWLALIPAFSPEEKENSRQMV